MGKVGVGLVFAGLEFEVGFRVVRDLLKLGLEWV